MNSKCENLRAI